MELILAILAGAVQGLTEFLPISSTAHLIIFQKIFNLPESQFGLTFDASLHLGTLIAVFIFFYRDYLKVFNLKNRLYLKLLLGTVPAVIFGLLFENVIENKIRSSLVMGISLIVFSLVIFFAERTGQKNKNDDKISVLDALIIGIAQSIALIPGVSRSGSTISAGLFLGQTRESAARFAFLLSGPIIAGAGLKKFSEALAHPESFNVGIFLTAIASSFIFGYLTIKFFLKYLGTKNLYPFIYYRLILGAVLILFSILA